MSDERLREAERRWRETGSVEDEARYLLERARVGDLTRDRVDLAKLVLGIPGADRPRVDEAFRAMLVELGGIDEPATMRSWRRTSSDSAMLCASCTCHRRSRAGSGSRGGS